MMTQLKCQRRRPKSGLILVCLGLLSMARIARAEPTEPTEPRDERPLIGFSRLNERTARDTPVQFGQNVYRVFILDRLRSLGLRALGGEEDPFGNAAGIPELVLGGVVREFECRPVNQAFNCRFGLDWQVLDVRSGRVVYQTIVRGAVYDVRREAANVTVGKQMLTRAIDSLLGRPRFSKLLEPRKDVESEQTFPRAGFKPCSAGAVDMRRQASKATEATVIVESKTGTGSGFFLNDEGLVLTAAHVVAVADGLRARLQDGRTFPLDVIRSNRSADMALLRVRGGMKSSCLELSLTQTTIGTDVYAIGAPTGGQLAFSLTRGIVSGVRQWKGGSLLQTDAAINPGNSGGPLLGADGRVKAVVSRKLVGTAIEGLAFGVPVGTGLLTLGLAAQASTAAVLREPAVLAPAAAEATGPFVDKADDIPSLDPAGDQQRASSAQNLVRAEARAAAYAQLRLNEERTKEQNDERDRKELARLTPGYVPVMKWGGLALAGAGAIAAVATVASYDSRTSTKREYESLRLWNDLAFVSMAVGATSFGASFFLTPRLPSRDANAGPSAGQGSAAWLQLRGTY